MLDSLIFSGTWSEAMGRGLHYSLIRPGFPSAEATGVRIIEGLL
jgi:hypothetical protein